MARARSPFSSPSRRCGRCTIGLAWIGACSPAWHQWPGGVNFLPWTGPTLRASAALHIALMELFRPLITVQAVGLVYVFTLAYLLGRREAKRLDLGQIPSSAPLVHRNLSEEEKSLRRPCNFW